MLDRTTPPAIRPMAHFSIARPERRVLRNDIRLNILQMGDEDVVRFDVLMRGGQWCQSQPLQSLFTNRMLREGCHGFSSSQIAERLDFYGAWLDLSSSLNCNFVTLYSLGKYFEPSLEVLAAMLKEPTFPEEELRVVVAANKQQFLVNSQRVDVIARKRLNRALFGERHPLGRYAEAEDYDRIHPAVLRRFYKDHYHSANCSLYVSGKVSPHIIECIERQFGDAPWGREGATASECAAISPCPMGQKRLFIEKADALQSSVRMGCRSIDQSHPDYTRLKVLVTLYGGYFGSRLMSNIREEKGYTYGVSAGLANYPAVGMIGIGSETANEYVEPLIKEVYHEMDRLCQEPVPEEELQMVKNYLMGELCRSYENALSLPEAWIMQETAGLPDDYLERSAEEIQAVTAEELLLLARRYFRPEAVIEVVAGKKL